MYSCVCLYKKWFLYIYMCIVYICFMQEYARTACNKIHNCGHMCGGVQSEAVCLPCLHGCSANTSLRQDADDMCMICFTEALSCAPALQVSSLDFFSRLVLSLCVCYWFASVVLWVSLLTSDNLFSSNVDMSSTCTAVEPCWWRDGLDRESLSRSRFVQFVR